jgi:hypothetical protein
VKYEIKSQKRASENKKWEILGIYYSTQLLLSGKLFPLAKVIPISGRNHSKKMVEIFFCNGKIRLELKKIPKFLSSLGRKREKEKG